MPARWAVQGHLNVAIFLFGNFYRRWRKEKYPIHLRDYLYVYYRLRIRSGLEFTRATATVDEIKPIWLVAGNVASGRGVASAKS